MKLDRDVEWDERAALYLTQRELVNNECDRGELRIDDGGYVWLHDGHGNVLVLGKVKGGKSEPDRLAPPPVTLHRRSPRDDDK